MNSRASSSGRPPDSLPKKKPRNWEHFAHDADIGIRGIGASPAAAFEQAAMALTAVILDPNCVVPRRAVSIRCAAPDLEVLFVDWLNALVFEMATRRMVFARFAVAIEDHRLRATAWGEAIDVKRHRPAAEVKGATYTALRVGRNRDGTWTAECVVDV